LGQIIEIPSRSVNRQWEKRASDEESTRDTVPVNKLQVFEQNKLDGIGMA
jgi:hypothetical protein